MVGIVNAGGVDVQANDATTYLLREVEGVASGTAADFEDERIASQAEYFGDFVGLFRGDPTGLAEVLAVGVDAHVTVHMRCIVGVGAIVEVDFL